MSGAEQAKVERAEIASFGDAEHAHRGGLAGARAIAYPAEMTDRHEALLALLRRLGQLGYRFTAVTPATHARVLARPAPARPGLRDALGWNRPFAAGDLPLDVVDLLRAAGGLEARGGQLLSKLRVASLGDDLFMHSRYPTEARDAVFFGPDTYRFAAFVARHLPGLAPARVVDMGAGSGAGGIAVARLAPAASITLVDSNRTALELAAVNAAAAGVAAELREGSEIPPGADLVVANPPYMMDGEGRSYRHGGALLGGQVARDWAEQALHRLAPGGTLLLYTGAAHAGGEAPLLSALAELCAGAGASLDVEELDPDVFGEELERPVYAGVERIAAVGAVIRRPG